MEKGWDIVQDRIVGKLVLSDKRVRPVLPSECTNIISGFCFLFCFVWFLNVEHKHRTCCLSQPWPAAWWVEGLAMLQTFLSYL